MTHETSFMKTVNIVILMYQLQNFYNISSVLNHLTVELQYFAKKASGS